MSLQVFSENKAEVLKYHGKTQKDLDEDVKILKEWIEKETHLPRSLLKDDNFLENSLIRKKYSIEKTKQKIENYCTLKGQHWYMFENLIDTIKPTQEPVFFHYVEKLKDDNLQRILIIKIFDEQKFDITRAVGISLVQRELTSRFDYNDGEIVIADYTECSAQLITKFRVNALAHSIALAVNGHSTKMKEIHIINKFANTLITFLRPFFSEKMKSRFYSHASIDDVKNIIPKKYLPRDYGGDQKSLQEMREDWEKIFKENHEMMKNALEQVSREDLRIEGTTKELQGTFKKLIVD